jgi:hypothetical protein
MKSSLHNRIPVFFFFAIPSQLLFLLPTLETRLNSNSAAQFFIITSHGPNRKHNFQQPLILCVYRSVSKKRVFSIVTCVFVAAERCLPIRSLSVDISSDFTIGFRASCHILSRSNSSGRNELNSLKKSKVFPEIGRGGP